MAEFETAGLEDRMKHLDFSYNQERQVMAAKWDSEMREMKTRLQVAVMRGRMDKNEAMMRARQFAQSKRAQAMEFDSKYQVERNRLQTFYQPATQDTMDPVAQYKGLVSEKNTYESELAEFQVQPGGKVSAPINIPFAPDLRKGKVPFAGGAVQIKEYQQMPDGKGGYKKVLKLRDATPEELRRWANAQAGLERVNKQLGSIRTNRHIAARDRGSAFDRQGGTFGQAVKETMPDALPARQPQIDFTSLSDEELQRLAEGR